MAHTRCWAVCTLWAGIHRTKTSSDPLGGRWVLKVSTSVSAVGSVECLMKWFNGSVVGNVISGARLCIGYP